MRALTQPETGESHPARKAPHSRWTYLCGALVVTILYCLTADAIFDRNFVRNIADGVSYLDITDAVARGHMSALLNAYWSPGYPLVLFAGLKLLNPSPPHQLAAIYAINAGIAVFALLCLTYFMGGLPEAEPESTRFGLDRRMLFAVALALFLLAVATDVPVYQITPDLLLGAWLWVSAGAFLRIAREQRMAHYVILALALSIAYFTKAVAFPLAVVALILLPFAGGDRKKALRGSLIALTLVGALAVPYIAKLSASKGRFTSGIPERSIMHGSWTTRSVTRYRTIRARTRAYPTYSPHAPATQVTRGFRVRVSGGGYLPGV